MVIIVIRQLQMHTANQMAQRIHNTSQSALWLLLLHILACVPQLLFLAHLLLCAAGPVHRHPRYRCPGRQPQPLQQLLLLHHHAAVRRRPRHCRCCCCRTCQRLLHWPIALSSAICLCLVVYARCMQLVGYLTRCL